MIKTKKTKKNNKQESSDIHQEIRHLGVVIENVNDNVKLVAKQHRGIKEDIKGVKEDVHDIKQTLTSHTEMIRKLMIDITIVKEDVEFIKSSLKKKVDVEEFAALERRVALLEKHR